MRAPCAVVGCIAAACTPRAVPDRIATPSEGIAIMVYARGDTSYGVVDDRRWIEVAGTSIVLDRIDPGATLPSLVIEPLAARDEVRVGACARERIDTTDEGLQRLAQVRSDKSKPENHPLSVYNPQTPSDAPAGLLSPFVRCAVTGKPGRYLVRVLYVAPAIRYHAQHDIGMTTETRATIITRFAITTPGWNKRAEISLFDGLPGSDDPPREVAHGSVVLDGSTAVLSIPARIVGAKLRRVFDGAVRDRNLATTDVAWGKDSRSAVWVWLELDDTKLASGPVRARVELAGDQERDVIVPDRQPEDHLATARQRLGTALRLPLWIDDTLHGVRRRWIDRADSGVLVERFQLSVSNSGDAPREDWVEEHLRASKRREVKRAWPAKPAVVENVARSKLVVPSHGNEQLGYVVSYDL